MARESETEDILYDYICSNPGMCTYDISKELNMTGGRVRHMLFQLEKKGLIKFKYDKRNPRTKKLTFPISKWNLLPKSFKAEIKKMIKKN